MPIMTVIHPKRHIKYPFSPTQKASKSHTNTFLFFLVYPHANPFMIKALNKTKRQRRKVPRIHLSNSKDEILFRLEQRTLININISN